MQVITNSHEKTTLEEACGDAWEEGRGGREAAAFAGCAALIFAYIFGREKSK